MQFKNKKEKFISLKEAGVIFGYASDYIGWLIRKGKIPGKRNYSEEEWKVSLEALLNYLNKKHKKIIHRKQWISLDRKYVSLKEAAKISGYASDYIGYLIRKKIVPGEKVYLGISWLTTEEGIRRYLEKKRRKKTLFSPFTYLREGFSFLLKVPKYAVVSSVLGLIIFGGLVAWAVAPKNPIQTIEIYPNQIQDDSEGISAGSYGASWQNSEKVLGPPEVGPESDFNSFSDSNSAKYQQGLLSLVLSNFNNTQTDLEIKKEKNEQQVQVEEQIQEEQQEQTPQQPEESQPKDEQEQSLENSEQSQPEELEQQKPEVGGAAVEAEEGASEEVGAEGETQTETETQTESENQNETENISDTETSNENQTEIINNNEPQSSEPQPESPSEIQSRPESQPSESGSGTETTAEPISFFDPIKNIISNGVKKLKNFFERRIVRAQEITTFEELNKNEFISAKIKFSLAIGEKVADLISPEIKEKNPEITPEVTPEITPERTLEQTPESTPEITPETSLEPVPESTIESIPEIIPETPSTENTPASFWQEIKNFFTSLRIKITELGKTFASKIISITKAEEKNTIEEINLEVNPTPESTPETTPEATPEITPEPTSEITPEATPEPTPEFTSEPTPIEILSDIDAKIIIWYSLDGENWQKLDTISKYPLSNALNSGYFEYDASFLKNWDDVKNLKIKFEGIVGGETVVVAYLDSVWLEVNYQEKEEDYELRALKKDWRADETPTFEVISNKKENIIESLVGRVSSVFEEEPKVDADLIVPDATELKLQEGENFKSETHSPTKITVFKPKDFRPGKYNLKIDYEINGKVYNFEQDFTWGVLAINVNKSIYLPNEKAYLQMGVLDDLGHTLCNADLILEITAPDGTKTVFKTPPKEEIIEEEAVSPASTEEIKTEPTSSHSNSRRTASD